MKSLRIGIVSQHWPPFFGGAQVYAYRLAQALRIQDVTVFACTFSKESSNTARNGEVDVKRIGDYHYDEDPVSDFAVLSGETYAGWCEQVAAWVGENRLTHVLFNQMPSVPIHAALVQRIRDAGPKVGIIQHDLDGLLHKELYLEYWASLDWEIATRRVVGREYKSPRNELFEESSSYFLERDFTITNSCWMQRFLPLVTPTPSFCYHPPLDFSLNQCAPLSPVTISMLNPRPLKGAVNMAHIIIYGDRAWTFRVHRGGWGNQKWFEPLVEEASIFPGRVNFVDYVEDMSSLYQASQVFIYPSRIEGYGMAPVEAMLCGTPVVASDYPTILEGVGEAAALVPICQSGQRWIESIEQVISNRAVWQAQARERSAFLKQRQSDELGGLLKFLVEV